LSRLVIPRDKHKDQTYFLWKLTQKELAHVLFPLGDLLKSEVREIAKKANLSVADKKDSQGICFVGNVEVKDFLSRRLKKKAGVVRNKNGKKLGNHDGVWFYTIGQRGGWEILPEVQRELVQKGETPIFYVISKDAADNELIVAEDTEALSDFFEVSEVNLFNIKNDIEKIRNLYVRIRHGGELIGARAKKSENGYFVELIKGVRGVASGQSAVFYSEDGVCIGGGVIV